VAEFLRRTAGKLDSRKFYKAPLEQYVAAVVHRAEFLALADELDKGPQEADWPLAPPEVTLAMPRPKLRALPTIKSIPTKPSQSSLAPPHSLVLAADRTDMPIGIQEGVSEQNSDSEYSPENGQEPRAGGRPRKWESDAERMATVREQRKPLILPPLPRGVYRAREVVTAKSSPRSTAHRDYHAALQGNRCFFCDRQFGTFIQKHSAKPEPLRIEDEHFIPRKLPGARNEHNRHAVCQICNGLKSDLVFDTEEQCRTWLADAWQLNGYREVGVHAIRYEAKDGSVLFEERLAA
jgi:hypothetical protein